MPFGMIETWFICFPDPICILIYRLCKYQSVWYVTVFVPAMLVQNLAPRAQTTKNNTVIIMIAHNLYEQHFDLKIL